MQRLELKATHKPLQNYYAALLQLGVDDLRRIQVDTLH
jgi:hypothetical protein